MQNKGITLSEVESEIDTRGWLLAEICYVPSGSFTSHKVRLQSKSIDTGPVGFYPYPNRLESLTICDVGAKAVISRQSF